MGNHGPPSTFWEFMALDGVFRTRPAQGVVCEMAYMGKFRPISPKIAQDIDHTIKAKKFQKIPRDWKIMAASPAETLENAPKAAESQGCLLHLIRNWQVCATVSHDRRV